MNSSFPMALSAGTSSSSSSSRPFTASKNASTFSLKIIKATKKINNSGKVEFSPLESGFVDVTAATAYIPCITDMVCEKWGADYKILGNDGLPIGDCSGTRGLL